MSGQIIVPEQRRQAVAPISTDNSIMAVISRAAADPTCDIEKMERLLAMHERMQAKEAEQASTQRWQKCSATSPRFSRVQ